jgi:putative tryptophan/tyrosine transport system substrate-binding protein
VFAAPTNPVEIGLIASLNRPGGNLTGFPSFNDEVTAKRFALLHEMTPKSAVIGVMSWTAGESIVKIVQASATALGRRIKVIFADTEREVEAAFAIFAELRVGALLVNSSPVYLNWGQQIVSLMARYGIPASYHRREFVEMGGLFSYGANLDEIYRQAGVYVGGFSKVKTPAISRSRSPASLSS